MGTAASVVLVKFQGAMSQHGRCWCAGLSPLSPCAPPSPSSTPGRQRRTPPPPAVTTRHGQQPLGQGPGLPPVEDDRCTAVCECSLYEHLWSCAHVRGSATSHYLKGSQI